MRGGGAEGRKVKRKKRRGIDKEIKVRGSRGRGKGGRLEQEGKVVQMGCHKGEREGQD